MLNFKSYNKDSNCGGFNQKLISYSNLVKSEKLNIFVYMLAFSLALFTVYGLLVLSQSSIVEIEAETLRPYMYYMKIILIVILILSIIKTNYDIIVSNNKNDYVLNDKPLLIKPNVNQMIVTKRPWLLWLRIFIVSLIIVLTYINLSVVLNYPIFSSIVIISCLILVLIFDDYGLTYYKLLNYVTTNVSPQLVSNFEISSLFKLFKLSVFYCMLMVILFYHLMSLSVLYLLIIYIFISFIISLTLVYINFFYWLKLGKSTIIINK